MLESTKRSISQVIFRHTPQSLVAIEESNVMGRVTDIKGDTDRDVDKHLLFKRIEWYVQKWKESDNGPDRVRGYSDMDEETIAPIRPSEAIIWDVFPYYFECTNRDCLVVSSPAEQKGNFTGKCVRCGSSLRQLKYVWFHHCGEIRPLYPLKQCSCPKHGRKYLYLHDTKRASTSRWRCRECNYERSLGMIPCSDPVCKASIQGGSEKFLRLSVWNDSWVYYPQTITFVNITNNQVDPIISSQHKDDILLSSFLGSIHAGQRKLHDKAVMSLEGEKCVYCDANIPLNANYCHKCGKQQPKKTRLAEQSVSQNKYDFQHDDDITIYAVIRDLERTLSALDVQSERGDKPELKGYKKIEDLSDRFGMMGLSDIYFASDFPLSYATIGYSRFQSKPPSWLKAFSDTSGRDTKIPVYTNCVTTEAWLVQLSGLKIIKWLVQNKVVEPSQIDGYKNLDEDKAKIWVLELLRGDESELQLKVEKVLEELIHSYSHVMIQAIASESGLEVAGFGELLLPQALSFIIYAGETDVGGMAASFSQALDVVIDGACDQFRTCKFDPSCSEDDDSACVGCLYLPRGCVFFNEGISRVYLYGGTAEKTALEEVQVGYFDLD